MSASSSASEQAACHARTGLSARMTWGQGQGKEGENAGGAHGDAVRARLLVAAPREAGLGLGQVEGEAIVLGEHRHQEDERGQGLLELLPRERLAADECLGVCSAPPG